MSEFDKEEFHKHAKDAEAKRRAGTHVYHPHFGVIPIEKARALVGREDRAKNEIKPEDFRGDPETGAVKWSSATQTSDGKDVQRID